MNEELHEMENPSENSDHGQGESNKEYAIRVGSYITRGLIFLILLALVILVWSYFTSLSRPKFVEFLGLEQDLVGYILCLFLPALLAGLIMALIGQRTAKRLNKHQVMTIVGFTLSGLVIVFGIAWFLLVLFEGLAAMG